MQPPPPDPRAGPRSEPADPADTRPFPGALDASGRTASDPQRRIGSSSENPRAGLDASGRTASDPQRRIGSSSENPRAPLHESSRRRQSGSLGPPAPYAPTAGPALAPPYPLGASAERARAASASAQDARPTDPLPGAAAPAPAPAEGGGLTSLINKRVGPYRITALIAQGGMGTVYEAVHERMGRAVALKTLLAGAVAGGEEVQRFLNEARAAARLSHPNLVQIHDVGEHQGVRYIAMELVRGETLHGLIRRGGQLEEAQALRLVADAARGLAHAHQAGVLHRDLKPANVLIGSDGVGRLTDFGVAKAVGNQSLTATGTALGTPSYMSPEQAMGLNDKLDGRSDVYGLGAILYECLTGRPPFDLGTHLLTMQAVVSDPPAPPSTLRQGLSEEVEAICLKCLAKAPDDRYPTCEALVDDIERQLAGRTVKARPPTRAGLALRWLGRHVVGLAAVTAALAAALGGAALAAGPVLAARRAARAEVRAAEAVQARLAALTAEVERADAPRLRALLAELEPDALRAAAAREAADGDERAEAAARGAAAGLAAGATAGPAARAWLRLAELEPSARVRALCEAGALDEGEAGRTARLRLALLLAARPDAAARELAQGELQALAAGDDAAARRALVELAAGLAAEGRWAEALGAAARARGESDPRLPSVEAAGRLLGAPPLQLAPYDRAALAAGRGGPSLLLARGTRVWRARPAGRQEGEGRAAAEVAELAGLAAGDLDGDGEDEAVLVGVQGRVGVGRPEGDAATWLEWKVQVQTPHPPADVAVGDVDGDGKDDLALLVLQDRDQSCLLLGGRQGQEQYVRFPPAAQRAHAAGRVALADLDGDGRDEVVLGGTQFEPALEVLGWDPDTRTLAARARVHGLGHARGLVPYPLQGRSRGVLVVVDADRDDPRRPPAAPAWRGRDGVYLVERTASEPAAVVARWTFGEDGPPDAASRAAAQELLGVVLPDPAVEGGAWVGRAGRLDGRPRLELVPRGALGLERSPPPALAVELPQPARRALAADLDGDGDAELLLDQQVLGLGPATAQAPSLPRPAPATPAAALLRATRAAWALDDEAAARALGERLRTGHADTWEAAAALLLPSEALLGRAGAAWRSGLQAFARLDGAAGRRAAAEAEALHGRAAEAALEAAPRLPPASAERSLALARAAWCWERAGRPERAARALEQALAERGAPVDVTAPLRERLEAARRRANLDGLTLDLARPETRAGLLVRHPHRVWPDRRGVAVRAAPDARDFALLPVTVERTLPLALEVDLRTQGPAWASRAEAGLFEQDEEGGAGRVTGFVVSLWDVHSGMLGVQAVVQGRPAGPPLRLAGFHQALRLRLELAPRAGGGARVTARVLDKEEQLLHVVEADADATPPAGGALLAGVVTPPHGRPEDACTEQLRWPMEARVVLERLRLEALRPARSGESPALGAAHGLLAMEDARGARAAYQALVEAHDALDEEVPEARLFRGFARARLGEPGAEADLVEAVRTAPFTGLLLLEDLADEVLDGNPADLAVAGAAVRALARDANPTAAAVGRSLTGECAATAPPGDGSGDEGDLAALYLAMRATHDPRRWDGLARYKRLAPGQRLPRTGLPKLLDVPEQPLDDRAVEALSREQGGCLHQRHRALLRWRAARPGQPEPMLSVGWFYANGRFHGAAEATLRRALDRGGLRPDLVQRANLALAQVVAALGRLDDALAAIEAARAAGLDPGQAAQWEKTLRERLGQAATDVEPVGEPGGGR